MMTPRLITVASKVWGGARVIDVGTDHAYVPIYLAEQGVIASALATDVNRGPLMRANDNIEKAGLCSKIKTALADGLSGVDDSLYDTVIIAGMGGMLISDIIKNAPDQNKTFILQPMTAITELRQFLYEQSFEICDEELVQEGEKLYTVIVAKKGKKQNFEEIDLYVGKKLIENSDPLLPELLERLQSKLTTIALGLQKSSSPEKAKAYKRLISEIKSIKFKEE